MKLIQIIKEICSNANYVAIIAALISAITAVGIAIYNNKHKKDEPPGKTVIVIPPPVDPLSGLRADTTGIRDIDEEDINSS
ncbi:MAG: hypothetical protein ACI4XW_08225, partial [Candidatus Spyradocola sp.]